MELPVPEGITGIAVNVNNYGMVVGVLEDAATSTKIAVVWQLTEGENGPTFVDPVILAQVSSVREPDLNDAGQVVAVVRSGGTFQGQRWSVTWDGAAAHPLGTGDSHGDDDG